MRTCYVALVFLCLARSGVAQYKPTWESLDSRPIPQWFDQAKIGIFLHWGMYAVPSYDGGEWFWAYWQDNEEPFKGYMEQHYKPGFTYQDFASEFTAELFDPSEWAELFSKAGAKYVVMTSKHHEGFTMWPSSFSYSWNAKDTGPNRDLLGDLAEAVRNQSLRFGAYYSMYEWFNPMYNADQANGFNTSTFVDHKMLPEMIELVDTYRPEVFWVDGDWDAEDTYWKSKEFLTWLYNESPVKDTVAVNDRWGKGLPCAHGGYFSCADRFNPGTLQPHKWENAMTMDRDSWGYRRTAKYSDILTPDELIATLAQTISCGGNLLVNVGPDRDGRIIPIFEERLLQLGQWLAVNGEAVYETKPWTVQNDTLTPGVWYTMKGSTVYATVLDWPRGNVINLASVTSLFEAAEGTTVSMLGNEDVQLRAELETGQVSITFPDKAIVASEWAWVLKISPPATKIFIL